MEDEETLETGAVVGDMANFVHNLINQFLSDSVMAASIVVRGILLSCDHLFRVEQAAVGTGTNFINDIGLEIAVDCSWDIFALAFCTRTRQRTGL